MSVTLNRDWKSAMFCLALFAGASSAFGVDDDTRLVPALEQIEAESLALCGSPADTRPLGEALNALVDDAASEAATVPGAVSPVERLNDLIYRRLGIRSSRDIHNPCNLLPTSVLARKEGYCVGIAALYLALAERLDLPIRAVAMPSHVYLRWDDGQTRIDIETMALGGPVPDGLDERTVPDSPRARGAVKFPRDLDTNGFLAQVHNNLGVIHSERSDHERAAAEYRRALDLDPLLSAAWYNWGNDLLVAGQHREAIKKLDKALRLFPADTWALNNRGRAWAALEKESRARKDFEAALVIDPEFKPARRNLKALDQKPAPEDTPSPGAPQNPGTSHVDPH